MVTIGKQWLLRLLTHSATYVGMGVSILLVDLLTGRYLMFPILFVIPVVMSAWYCGSRLSYALAVLLPVGRLVIAVAVETPSPPEYIIANAVIRVLVLILIASLVVRTLALRRQLEARVETLVKICAWTRTVQYQGEWLSFEDYLRRRFNIEATHGMSPAETERQLAELMASNDNVRSDT